MYACQGCQQSVGNWHATLLHMRSCCPNWLHENELREDGDMKLICYVGEGTVRTPPRPLSDKVVGYGIVNIILLLKERHGTLMSTIRKANLGILSGCNLLKAISRRVTQGVLTVSNASEPYKYKIGPAARHAYPQLFIDNSILGGAIRIWVYQQTEAGLHIATIKTVRQMLLEKLGLERLTEDQKEFIKATTISVILKRKDELLSLSSSSSSSSSSNDVAIVGEQSLDERLLHGAANAIDLVNTPNQSSSSSSSSISSSSSSDRSSTGSGSTVQEVSMDARCFAALEKSMQLKMNARLEALEKSTNLNISIAHAHREYCDYHKNPLGNGFEVEMLKRELGGGLLCLVPGEIGTAWEGGHYPVVVKYPSDSSKAPHCSINRPVDSVLLPVTTQSNGKRPLFHPNVYPSGRLSYSIVDDNKSWCPSFCIAEILLSIQYFLSHENSAILESSRDQYLEIVQKQAVIFTRDHFFYKL